MNPSIAPGPLFSAASVLPTLNATWTTGNTAVNVIDTTAANSLAPNESYLFTFDLIVDPDEVDGVSQFNDNQASVSGDGLNFDGSTVTVTDDSHWPGATGGGDDEPTPLIIPEVITEKSLVGQTPASSGTQGNIDATYEFVFTNSGTVTLGSLSIRDDWSLNFGSAFIGVVDTDLSDGDVVAPPVSGVGGNTAYAGGATDNILDGLGQLLPGETVTALVTVEIDPDADLAALSGGQLINQANGAGAFDPTPGIPGDEVFVSDASDDPNNATDANPDSDGDADDPTTISVANVELTKGISNVVPATSGIADNFDVTFDLVVSNAGTETLSNLSLTDDIASQYGGAFVQVVNLVVLPGTATSAPAPNAAFNGTAGSDMLLGAATDQLVAGQSFTVQLTIEVDPDSPTANYDGVTSDASGDLENSATVNATSQFSGPVNATSDDPNNATDSDPDGDNQPNDPTGLIIANVDLQKVAFGPAVPASSGIAGNFDVTYDLTITNTGTDSLHTLSLQEDLAAQYGGGFVRVVPQGGAPATIISSTSTDVAELNSLYDGGAADSELFDNVAPNTNELRTGQSVAVRIVVEIDADNPGATLTNGAFTNQATVDAVGADSNQPVSDLSDDPNNATNNDPNGDNNPDDINWIRLPNIQLEKQVVGSPVPASSGVSGEFEVFYDLTITNTGSTPLADLSLVEDFGSQFGGAFRGVVGTSIATSSATDTPELNPAYDGGANSELIDNSGANTNLLDPGQSVTVRVLVRIDPDNPTATYDAISGDGDQELENQAQTSGTDPLSGQTPSDDSDDPTIGSDFDNNADNDPDDPTPLILPEVTLRKAVLGDPVPATSGTVGNFELTYDLGITNTGNDVLAALTLTENFATQFGGAFVGLVGTPTIVGSTASDLPEINPTYDGGLTDAQIFDNSGTNTNELQIGQWLVVRVVVEVDPNDPLATYSNGALQNQASTTGAGQSSGQTVDDVSDDPNDATNSDPNADNNPDDPTQVRLPNIALEKTLVAGPTPAGSGTAGNYDVVYEFVIDNPGSTPLENIQLTEDLVSLFGGGFVAVIGTPSIVSSTSTAAPTINTNFDGGSSDPNIFNGTSGLLEVNQSITVRMTIEVDPDSPTAIYDVITNDGNSDLENQATVSANDPVDPSTPIVDLSDDPTNPIDDDGTRSDSTDDDGEPDDPVSLLIPDLTLEKSVVGSPVFASSGIGGNFDVTYELVLTSTGNDNVTNLSLLEDFASQFGGAFVGLVGSPTLTVNNATDEPEFNAAYDGGVTDAELFDNTGLNTNWLAPGESVAVQIVAEVDLDAAGAVLTNGELVNQADVSGVGLGSAQPTSDTSDDPTVSSNVDSNADNKPDDATSLAFPADASVGVSKAAAFLSPIELQYTFFLEHFGDAQASDLSMTEDLDAIFGAGNYTTTLVLTSGPSSLAVNSSFDGSANQELLAANSFLSPGDTAQVTLTVNILNVVDEQGNGRGVYENQVTLEGSNPFGEPVSDISTAGDDPAPGGPGGVTSISTSVPNISGFVYSDANGNDQFDAGESGLIGVAITLEGTDIAGNPVFLTTITDADGFYEFEDLVPGTYTVSQSHPPQFLDGTDQIGTLGGDDSQDDQFTITIPPGGMDDSTDNNFGEQGLRPEFISKSLLLASTPDNYWENINAAGSGVLGVWVPFEASVGGAVKASLINADSIEVDLFDENMNLLNPAQEGEPGGTWVVHEGQRYFVRLRGTDSNFDFELAFGREAQLPIELDLADNVVTAVGSARDEHVELILGAQTHLLVMAGYQFEFDASVIDTFLIGAGSGNDTVRVTGTDLDDVGNVLDIHGSLVSSEYEAHVYSFDTVIFDGQGGDDYTQIYGSNGDDNLQAIPQDTTLTTPTQTMQMLGFERVDSYGRLGNDYASMYGTQGDDEYWTFDTYEVLRSENMTMRTIGWDRVDAFGRGGNDTANLFDSAGDDSLYVFPEYTTMVSDHLFAVAKGFEQVNAESKNGGLDRVYFREIVTAEHIFASANMATVTGSTRSVWARSFHEVELEIDDEDPSLDLKQADFQLKYRS